LISLCSILHLQTIRKEFDAIIQSIKSELYGPRLNYNVRRWLRIFPMSNDTGHDV
jgi:hypothetical protein